MSLSEKELNEVPPLPPGKRKCTDILFLIVFAAFWVGMFVIAAIGFQNGDPQRLVYGTDYLGNTCGGPGPKQNMSYVVFPRPDEDVLAGSQYITDQEPWKISFFSICAAKCPLTDEIVCDDPGEILLSNATAQVGAGTREEEAAKCLDGFFAGPSCYDSRIRNHCWVTLFDTTPMLFRCFPKYIYTTEKLPASGCVKFSYYQSAITGENITTCVKYKQVLLQTTVEPTGSDILFDSYNTVAQAFNRYIGDVVKAWPVIIISGLGVSTVIGLTYIISLWCFVRVVVWGSVVGVQVMAILFTLYLYVKAGVITSASIASAESAIENSVKDANTAVSTKTGLELINAPANGSDPYELLGNGSAIPFQIGASANYRTQFLSAAYFMTVVTVLLFFLIILLGRRIARAIEVFEEASRAIRANPCLILVPFVSVPAMLLLIAWWAVVTTYLASAGTYDLTALNHTIGADPYAAITNVSTFGPINAREFLIAYQLLGFLWSTHCVTAIGVYVVAGTVSHWYWQGSPDSNDSYGNFPLINSVKVVFRFHLGTVAFGSFLVAIVQFFRYLLSYIEARAEAVSRQSRIARMLACILQYCMWCLQRLVMFISRNAFIFSAMYGDAFCVSTRKAFETIMANLATVALITFLGDLILRFGQILISLAAAFACWAYLDSHAEYNFGGNLELNTFWWPTFLSWLLGWFVGNECLSIYDITVDTLLLSFCEDAKLQKNKANHTMATSKSMHEFISKHDASDDVNRQHFGKTMQEEGVTAAA